MLARFSCLVCGFFTCCLPIVAQEVRPATLVENPNLPQDLPRFLEEPKLEVLPSADPLQPPKVVVPAAPPLAFGLLTDVQLQQTYLPGKGTTHREFGINDTDLLIGMNTPWEMLGKPVKVKFGFGAHFWDGPGQKRHREADPNSSLGFSMFGMGGGPRNNSPRSIPYGLDPDLPGDLYDLFLDFGWRPRFAEWLFADIGLTPGVYGDFRTTDAEFFRLRGRSLAIIALSEKFQFVAGLLYINRNGNKLIPAGGFLWKPNERVDIQAVFPLPKASLRVSKNDFSSNWLYVAGEFGGGTWAYQPSFGPAQSVDYNDYRILFGYEYRRADGWAFRLETGLVAGRELIFNDGREFDAKKTALVRLSVNF
ncbi:MAG: hypothetical protein ACRCZF_28260 [Gemmataceae bacterium]